MQVGAAESLLYQASLMYSFTFYIIGSARNSLGFDWLSSVHASVRAYNGVRVSGWVPKEVNFPSGKFVAHMKCLCIF